MGSSDAGQATAFGVSDQGPAEEMAKLYEDDELIEKDEELVEIVWIDGMCGVY